jgi:ABC-type uncharacterized transport system permease subunit
MSKALVTVITNVLIALLFGGIFQLIGQRAGFSEATISIGTIIVGVAAILIVQMVGKMIFNPGNMEDKQ